MDVSVDNKNSLVESKLEENEQALKSTVETVTLSQTTKFVNFETLPMLPEKDKEKVIDDELDSSNEIIKTVEEDLITEERKDEDTVKDDKEYDKTVDLEVKEITENHEKTESKLSIASLVELDHSYGLAPRDVTPTIDIEGLENETPEKEVIVEHITPKVEKKPTVEEKPVLVPVCKHLFPVRSFEQDDELVYEFLKTGLDYEDAHFLRTGFDQLNQVCSESVISAKWSFHPDILSFSVHKNI